MFHSLPEKPNLEFLRKQAKDLLKAQRAGDPKVCSVFRYLKRFSQTGDQEILSAVVTLHESRFAL